MTGSLASFNLSGILAGFFRAGGCKAKGPPFRTAEDNPTKLRVEEWMAVGRFFAIDKFPKLGSSFILHIRKTNSKCPTVKGESRRSSYPVWTINSYKK
jgi:hypothetical protein